MNFFTKKVLTRFFVIGNIMSSQEKPNKKKGGNMTNSVLLKSKMILKGYTLSALAEKLDFSKTTLSQKINGKIKFSQIDIRNISRILELSADEIKEIFLN